MNKTIVLEPSADMRKLARQSLAGNWKTAVLATLLMNLVVQVPPVLLGMMFPSGGLTAVLNLYSLLITGPLMLGITMLFLNMFRQKQTGPLEVFYGFEYMLKAVLLRAVVLIFIGLWLLLLVVPGIIAAYRYSMAMYILADDPTKGVFQCINESKYLMTGNKAKMFCLDFSFIGWIILCTIPISVFAGIYSFNVADSIYVAGMTQTDITAALQQMPVYRLGAAIFGIGYLFLNPYMSMASTCFFELANGNLTVRRVRSGEMDMEREKAPVEGFAEVISTEEPVYETASRPETQDDDSPDEEERTEE